jgi:AraC-like DNA-binding protein
MTPYEFVLRTRIQGASEALARPDLSILQITVDFGFCDQSAFTLQFRRHTGMTPKQFRGC